MPLADQRNVYGPQYDSTGAMLVDVVTATPTPVDLSIGQGSELGILEAIGTLIKLARYQNYLLLQLINGASFVADDEQAFLSDPTLTN